MAEESPANGATGLSALARQLAPALEAACDDRLRDIHWFQAAWQQGGAATGYAQYETDGGPLDVVVKLPVGPVEYRFTTELSACDAPTPHVYAHGLELGGYDLAWMVLERLPGEPLASNLSKRSFIDLTRACAMFHKCAAELRPPTPGAEDVDWAGLLTKARASVKDNDIPDGQRWNKHIKEVQRILPSIAARWTARPINTWRHGDLHPGNAMIREDGSPCGPPGCVLLDLAEIGPGHWVEDAVYLERLFWGKPELLHGAKPVKLLSKARRDLGLDNGEDHAELANIRRVMLAACVPAFLHREGHPKYLAAALDVLDRITPTLK